MFLAWNYTLEAFFWIILAAIILVSLTILLTGPAFRSSIIKTSGEALSLKGMNLDKKIERGLNKENLSNKKNNDEVYEKKESEEDNDEVIPLYVKFLAYANLVAYVSYSFFITFIGVIITVVELSGSKIGSDGVIESALAMICGTLLFLTGLFSFYGLMVKDKKWLRDSCRITAGVFLLGIIWNVEPFEEDAIGFTIVPLLFSGDVKRLWERILSNERIKQLMEKGESLGIDPRLLFFIGVIALAFGIIPAAFLVAFILVYQNWDKIVSFFSSD
jgi:hypothetical protein